MPPRPFESIARIASAAAAIALLTAAPAQPAGQPDGSNPPPARKKSAAKKEKPPRKAAEARSESAPDRMDFKHNIIPGELNSYEVRRATRRTRQIGDSLETFSYEQIATWTQINIADPQPASVMLYQMMADQPARALGYFVDDKQLKTAPPAAVALLSRGSTRLESGMRSLRDSPALAPRVASPERVILELLLDFAHWPAKPLVAGHKWERRVSLDDFDGRQVFEFVDLAKERGDVMARVTLFAEGRLTGEVADQYEFGKLQAIIHWARMDQRLERIEAQASYRRTSTDPPIEYDMKIEVALVQSQRLADTVQEHVKQQVTAINRLAQEVQLGHGRQAAKLIQGFVSQWPGSPWMPVIDELRSRVDALQDEPERLDNAAMQKSLTGLFVELEAAAEKNDTDRRENAARLVAGLAGEYAPRLRKLAASDDEQLRGLAAFALAFAGKPADFALAEAACADRSPRVRTMAITGIAAGGRRGSVRADVLLALLEDATVGIRARAADAVAACIAREDFSVHRLVETLDQLMVHDDSPAVRRAAIGAIAAIGAPADLPRLEQALFHELDKRNRAEIQRAIERLKRR